MNAHWTRLALALSTLVATTAVSAPALAASSLTSPGAQPPTEIEIPTRLTNEPTPEQPEGMCSLCTVEDLGVDRESSTSVSLELYFEDDGQDAVADIDVRVLLLDGTYRTITVPSVLLYSEELHFLDLPSGNDWLWDDVQFVWIVVR